MSESAIELIISEHAKHDPRRGYDKRESARAELATLRATVEAARITRDELYALIDQHVSVTDEWGGSKLADWKWGRNVCVSGIDDAADAIMDRLSANAPAPQAEQTS